MYRVRKSARLMQQFQFEQLQLQAIPTHCRDARVGGEYISIELNRC